nr:hypothetical protein [Tanacetum cinerariifolium]
MDKSWMRTSWTKKQYINGVKAFIKYAVHNLQEMRNIDPRGNKQQLMMPCPCTTCLNHIEHKVEEVQFHLFKYEIDLCYTKWDKHGKRDEQATTAQILVNAITEFVDDADFDMDFDAEKPLYKGCPDFTKLSAIVKLLNLKGKYGAFDKFFIELLGLLKKMLPGDNEMVEKTYQAKKVMRMMGSGYKKIHLESISEDLRWHATRRIIDGALRHLAYSQAWCTIDEKFPEIAKDPRNLWLGISADGVDVNSGTRHYSVWLVVYVIYNLPPWLCMKKSLSCFRKEISLQELDELQLELVVTLCLLEKFFPSSFFDIMIHLTVHLTREVKLCGPIWFRCMYPFERCMKIIKGHVRNKNRPERCIAEETIVEETIEFFSEYHKTMKTIGIATDKHVTNENEDGKPLSAGKSSEATQASFKNKKTGKRIALLENEHSKSFAKWLRKEVERELAISKDSVSETIRWISYVPYATIVKYEAYNINGYTFHTKSNDGIVYQNSETGLIFLEENEKLVTAFVEREFLVEGWVRVGGKVLISLSDLIFTNCKVLSQSGCGFVSDLAVHDFGWFLDAMRLVVELDFISWNNKCFVEETDDHCTVIHQQIHTDNDVKTIGSYGPSSPTATIASSLFLNATTSSSRHHHTSPPLPFSGQQPPPTQPPSPAADNTVAAISHHHFTLAVHHHDTTLVRIISTNHHQPPPLVQAPEGNMNPIATQQAALDNALVPSVKRLKIERCNARITFSKPQKAMYNQMNVDYVALLWEDFMYQVDNREISSAKKEHMPYPRFIKVIINHLISKDNTNSMSNRTNLYTIRDDTLLGTLKFVSKTEDYHKYGALIPNGMINDDIKLFTAYKTYLDYATRKVPPKKARKFKKPASPKLKSVPVSPKEPTQKGKRVKRPAKKATTALTTDVVITDTPDKSVSKKKAPAKADRGKGIEILSDVSLLKDAQLKETLRKSKRETHKLQDSCSSEGADFESEVNNEDENDYLNDEDDDGGNDGDSGNNDDGGNDAEGSEQTNLDDDENPSFTLKDYKEEEQDEEYMHTPEKDKFDDEDKMYEEEDDDVAKKLYGDLNITQGLRDTDMINVEQGGEDQQNASHESDVNEIASLMNTSTIPPPPPPVNPSLTITQQQTPDSTTTTTNPTMTLLEIPNFASLFQFDQRVSTLETNSNKLREESEAENQEFFDQVDSTIKTIIKERVKAQVSKIMPQIEKYVTESLGAKVLDEMIKTKINTPPLDQTEGRKEKSQARMLNHQKAQSQRNQSHLDIPKAPNLILNLLKWISTIAKAREPPRTFDELIGTTIYFSSYVMNHLKIDNQTQEILVGRGVNLLKGTCKSFAELEYHFKECYKAVNDKLDWNNLEGHAYPFDLSKPLALIEDQGRQFKEDDFPRINLCDIEDMLTLLVQKKLFNLDIDDRYDLGVALRMFTRRIVILHRVEDLQLGVESHQKNLNINRPETFRSDIPNMIPYTAYKNLKESYIKISSKETG